MKVRYLKNTIQSKSERIVINSLTELLNNIESTKEKETILSINNDIFVDDTIEITNRVKKLTIEGNGHKIHCLKNCSFNDSENEIIFETDVEPLHIFVNGEVRFLSESHPLSVGAKNFYKLSSSDNTNVTITTNDTLPELDGQELVNFSFLWCGDISRIKSVSNNTIGVYKDYVSQYIFKQSNLLPWTIEYYTFRLLNLRNTDKGHFWYRKNGNKYTIHYIKKDNETVINISVPSNDVIFNIHNLINVNIDNIKFVGTSSVIERASEQGERLRNSAIEITNCINVNITNCDFYGMGNFCMNLDKCQKCSINGNNMHELLVGGIKAFNEDYNKEGNVDLNPSSNIIIANNIIENYGCFAIGACAMHLAFIEDSAVIGNTISNGNYTAISLGWSQGYEISRTRHNYIAQNHIHHIFQNILTDGGAIYTMGKQYGTIIEKNKIHDVYGKVDALVDSIGFASGLYLDEASSGVTERYNLVYNCTVSQNINYGEGNVIYNNLFADPLLCQFNSKDVKELTAQSIIYRNIFIGDKDVLTPKTTQIGCYIFSQNLLDSNTPMPDETNLIHNNYKSDSPIVFEDEYKVADVNVGFFRVSKKLRNNSPTFMSKFLYDFVN